jgi:hypothetical protein
VLDEPGIDDLGETQALETSVDKEFLAEPGLGQGTLDEVRRARNYRTGLGALDAKGSILWRPATNDHGAQH